MTMHFVRRLACAGAVLLACGAAAAVADPLPAPTGEPILTVSGSIANTNDGTMAVFDREMLESVGTVTFSTMTPWYDHVVEFEGVPLATLLQYVGAAGTEVTAIALNDYSSTIPVSDFEEFGVILAMKRDGEIMPVRDKGPLFIVYPYDSDPALRNEQYYSRSVWQVKALDIH
jgi:hypothetical protein